MLTVIYPLWGAYGFYRGFYAQPYIHVFSNNGSSVSFIPNPAITLSFSDRLAHASINALMYMIPGNITPIYQAFSRIYDPLNYNYYRETFYHTI